MSTKTKQYAHQALAACGFAVMSSAVAYRLRPDLWASGQECAFDFQPKTPIEHVTRMSATVDALGQVLVLTRSTNMLAERIEWVTGFKVGNITQAPSEPVQVNQKGHDSRRQADDHLIKLRELAGQVPPTHDCRLRKEILAAQAELQSLAG